MYKIFIIIIAFAFSIPASAQTRLDDLIREVTDSIGVTVTKDSVAKEVAKPSMGNMEIDLIANAILPELSIIREQYRLELDGKYYGKNGLPYYGETYTLGIKIAGGLLLSEQVKEPWKYDSDYQRDNASGKYTPKHFWSYQRALDNKKYNAVALELDNEEHTAPINAGNNLYLHFDTKTDFGLSMDQTSGEKSGVMIWAYSTTNVQDSVMSVELRQTSLTIDVKADSILIPMSPDNQEKIIGGLYVVPRYEGRGCVQYMLVGVAVRTDATHWGLQLLVSPDNTTSSGIAEMESKSPDNKKSGKKKSKVQRSEATEPTPQK